MRLEVTLLWYQPHGLPHWNAMLLIWEQLDLHNKRSEVFTKTRPPAASLPFKGQVTEQKTIEWPIAWLRSDAGEVASWLVDFLALRWKMQRIEDFPSNGNTLLYTVYFQQRSLMDKLQACEICNQAIWVHGNEAWSELNRYPNVLGSVKRQLPKHYSIKQCE